MSAGLILRPGTESDGVAIADIGRRAFRGGVGGGANSIVFPDDLAPATQEEAIEQDMSWRVARKLGRIRRGEPTIVAVDSATNQVVGFAQWEQPAALSTATEKSPSMVTEPGTPKPPSFSKERVQKLEDAMDAVTEKALGEKGYKDMWYLAVLGVDPNQQRRGIGKLLLQWGLDQADRDGTEAYLVATAEGKPLYQANGFKVLAEDEVFGMPVIAMLRDKQ